MGKKSIYDWKLDEIVPVFHFGKPDKMKVIGHDEPTNQVRVQHIGYQGSCYYTPETLNRMAENCKNYSAPIKTPVWWNDLYTDANGNCFSDADNGL